MTEDPWDAHLRMLTSKPSSYQDVLNQSWPPPEAFAAHKSLRENRPRDRWVDVTVRVVLEHDGETYLRGVVIRWWTPGRQVLVQVDDGRINGRIVWVSADDVRRA